MIDKEQILIKDRERGIRAEAILRDPLVIEAFDKAEAHFVAMFKTADLRDEAGIVRAKDLLHAVTLVRRFFEDTIRYGKAADRALDPKKRGTAFLGDILKWRK
jgi:hypothetical protein